MMHPRVPWFGLLWWVVPLLLASCSFGDEPSVCAYNVRLDYWHAGSGTENRLTTYVTHLRQYLFNEAGTLVETRTLQGADVTGWSGTLPDGSYTFVLWGNLREESDADGKTRPEQIEPADAVNCNDMLLSARQEGAPPGYRGNTSRLYYGTAAVEVKDGILQRKRIYLSQAHAELSVTVRWMTDTPSEGIYRMRLKGVPALYGFTGGLPQTVPSGDGELTLPQVGREVTYHETNAAMNYEGEVLGQFVTYRFTSGTHPLWSLWKDGQQVIKDLDLYLFFNKLSLDLDTNAEQVFDLLVSVYDDKVVVTQITAADWDEGGGIG